jgi:hypothetical protein
LRREEKRREEKRREEEKRGGDWRCVPTVG